DRSFSHRRGRGDRPAGNPGYRAEPGRAGIQAGAAPDTFILVNDMDLFFGSPDSLFGTPSGADHTGPALFRINVVGCRFIKQPVDLVIGEKTVVVCRVF